MENPNSLAFKVFKTKYFKNDDFLKAGAISGCSMLWRSILWGREMLLKGLRWKVGNGLNILAFGDPWIPWLFSF